jgi:Xaa-Pro aminopeptidase
MLVLCARRYGLVVSLTRMVSFTPVSAELRRKHDAVCRVDASLILNSKPGVSYGEVLRRGILEYERAGFPEEWKLHHQGGPTGYVGRTVKVSPTTTLPVQASQAAAWNPSITGTKSEDTILIREKGFELLTQPRDWPLLKVSLDGGQVERCDILVKP